MSKTKKQAEIFTRQCYAQQLLASGTKRKVAVVMLCNRFKCSQAQAYRDITTADELMDPNSKKESETVCLEGRGHDVDDILAVIQHQVFEAAAEGNHTAVAALAKAYNKLSEQKGYKV